MRRVEILLDDQTDKILTALAASHRGDEGEAVREALRAHTVMEDLLDEIEDRNAQGLADQVERSERGFREGRFTTWEDVRRRAGL